LSAGLYVWSQRENAVLPMHKRVGADMQACSIAEIAISGRRAPAGTSFVSDCLPASVTHLDKRPGFVVVTRTVKEPDARSAVGRQTLSVLLDGRRTDGWQIADIQQAPNTVTIDISMLPLSGTGRAAISAASTPRDPFY